MVSVDAVYVGVVGMVAVYGSVAVRVTVRVTVRVCVDMSSVSQGGAQ